MSKNRSPEALYKLAVQVMKEDYVTEWFSTPHSLLQGKTPVQRAMESDEGYDRVEQLLASMIYGFPV
jgi:uncharacterized protein (DUF2384 family)